MLKYKKYSRKQIDLNTNFIVIFQIENNIMWTQFSTESLKNKYLIFHWNIETRKWEENWKRRGKKLLCYWKEPKILSPGIIQSPPVKRAARAAGKCLVGQ
jgi:hypothetical protein